MQYIELNIFKSYSKLLLNNTYLHGSMIDGVTVTHDTQNISVLISYIIFLLGSNVKLLNCYMVNVL